MSYPFGSAAAPSAADDSLIDDERSPLPLSPLARDHLGAMVSVRAATISLDWNYLVKGWLLLGEVSILAGPSNAGKTTLIIDLIASVANGEWWHGHRATRGAVVYYAAESPISVIERSKHLVDHDGAAELFVVERAPDLRDEAEILSALEGVIAEASRQAGEPVRLVVFDTLSLCLGDGDEAYNSDAVRVMRVAGEVARRTGAHIMLVHHMGKDKTSGPRGASAFVGSADTVIEVKKQEVEGREIAEITISKQRRMKKAGSVFVEIVPHLLGYDSDGDERTTSAVRPVSASEAAVASTSTRPASKRSAAVEAALKALDAEAVPEARRAGFSASEVIARCEAHAFGGMKPDSVQKAVRESLKSLAADEAQTVEAVGGGRYRIAGKPPVEQRAAA